MTDEHVNYSTGAQMLVDAARNGGIDTAKRSVDVMKRDRLPGVTSVLATAVADLSGPALTRELADDSAPEAQRIFAAAVEASGRGDTQSVEQLRPDSLTEAYAQLNAAVRILAELLAHDDGPAYLQSVRNAMLTDDEDTH